MSAKKLRVNIFSNTKCHKKCEYIVPWKTKLPAKKVGLAGIWTQVARFKVWSANHYTTKPFVECDPPIFIFVSFGLQTKYCLFRRCFMLNYLCLFGLASGCHLAAKWSNAYLMNALFYFIFQFILAKGCIVWVRSFVSLGCYKGFVGVWCTIIWKK